MNNLLEYKKVSKIVGLDKIYYATTPETLAKGLMGIKNLPENAGMLFVFPFPKIISFWMKDTFIALDIAFVDEHGIITEINEMTPHDDTHLISTDKCKYALEVNRGWFSKHGYRVGDQLFDK